MATPTKKAPAAAALPGTAESLGWAAIAWMEHYLVHGPGDVAGSPIELDVELCRFLVNAYKLGPGGKPAWDEVFFSRSKGRAKSELAGMVACLEFIGPARFDHYATAEEPPMWCPVCREVLYTYAPGDAVGRMVKSPVIRCLATEESQAGNTFANVASMLADVKERHAAAFPGLDLGRGAQTSTRIFRADGGEVYPTTASAASKDGGKETFGVADEVHLYVRPELKAMYTTVLRNLKKRKGTAGTWLLVTSTMYGVGEGSLAEDTHRAWRKGELAGKVLFDHVEAPADCDPGKPEDRVRGLRACYGPAAAWMDLESIAGDWDDPRLDRQDWLRYFFNRPVAGSSDFVDGAAWDALARPEEHLTPGEAITLGFDGGRTDDCTALVACRVSDGHLVTIRVWTRPPGAPYRAEDGGPGWRVPREEVDAEVRRCFDAYDVLQLWADPNRWEPYLDAWGSAWPGRVAEEWPTDRGTDKAVRLVLAGVKDGSLTHDGDPVTTRHVKNAALVRGRLRPVTEAPEDGDTLTRHYLTIRKKSQGKIDAAWALTLAYKARGWVLEKGKVPTRFNPADFIF